MWYRNIQIIKDTTDFISDPINWSANSLFDTFPNVSNCTFNIIEYVGNNTC